MKGIESTKIEYQQQAAAFSDYRQVKIALLGEGRIHGEDDVVAQRPYQASLICSLNDSELYVWTRADFQRAFRPGEAWTSAVSHAQAKEVEYVDRCRSTLDVHK